MSQHTLAESVGPLLQTPDICQIGGLAVLYPILEDLGLQAEINARRPSKAKIDLGRITLLLTLNRLLAPQPMYKVGAWADTTVIPRFLSLSVAQLYENRLGRAMDALYPIIGEAWCRLAARAVQQEGIDLSAVHWDTTSFYFEGEYATSDLARYGHSRDHRSDTKQVNLGLSVTSRERLPIIYQTLAGNTDDRATAVPHIKALVAFLSRPELAAAGVRPIIVSDCKMITPAAVFACHANHLYYLGTLPAEKEVKQLIADVPDPELAAHELSYRPKRQLPQGQSFVPYRGVWRPFTFTAAGESVTDRALVVWSAGKEQLDQQKRKSDLKRLLNGLATIQRQLNTGKFQKRDYVVEQIAGIRRGNQAKPLVDVQLTGEDGALYLHFCINRQRLAVAQRLDGKYALATNAVHLSENDALAYFKAQDGVEKSIAAVKGPLQVRPVFLQIDERIQVLVFFHLVALLVRAILELRLQRAGLSYSADKVLFVFASLNAVYQRFRDESQVPQLGKVSRLQQEILTALHLPPATRYVAPGPLVTAA